MLTYNVISHTHWDREWYFPFDKFRIRLVDMMDNVLEIFEKDSNYIFHLDAQIVVLEDYLEIRPYKKSLIEKYVREGRLIIGPWYVQNDFYLTSGEATIRNLLYGSRIAKEYGACARVGYAPDQFGNMSQLPQILNGFGVDNFIFGRGYQHMDWTGDEWVLRQNNTEFLWEGPDGTAITAIYLRHWYNNAQRFSADVDKALALLNVNKESFEGNKLSDQMLMMNGVDHLEAQEDLLPIIDAMNEALPADEQVMQTTMDDYIRKVQAYYEKNSEAKKALAVHKGELRTGQVYNILQNTLSARVYLKTENNDLQNLLEHYVERLYSIICLLGGEGTYPSDYMTYLWKELIKNHAHDSICGCSTDLVHENMEDRFKRIRCALDELLVRGLEFLGAHIDRSSFDEEDNMILVFNPHQNSGHHVIESRIDFLAEEEVKGFVITDSEGNEVPFALVKKERTNKNIYSAINLPGVKVIDAFTIQLKVKDVPAFGYQVLKVSKCVEVVKVEEQKSEKCQSGELSNDYLDVAISESGAITMRDKLSNTSYTDILTLIDEANVGDNYRFRKPHNSVCTDIAKIKPDIHLAKNTEFEKCYVVSYELALPEAFDFEKDIRSEKAVTNKIKLYVSLKADAKWVDFKAIIDNKSIDHRLRAVINTGVKTELSMGSTPYDLVEHSRRTFQDDINNDDQANSGFIAVGGQAEGIAIFNKGLYEYEHLSGDEGGKIALTLLSSTGYIQRRYDAMDEISPQMTAEGGNCVRELEVEFALCPYGCDLDVNDAWILSSTYESPALSYVQPIDLTKFNGGRPAAQGSIVSEIFYRPDTHPSMRLGMKESGICLKGDHIQITAMKQAENGEGHILRIFNTSDEESSFDLKLPKAIKKAELVTLEEDFEGELVVKTCTITSKIGPKKLMTVRLK